jgi:hypothetical protein
MDIDLDISALGLSDEAQDSLKHKRVYMKCPDGHEVPVRLTQGAGALTIYCPECTKIIEPRLS